MGERKYFSGVCSLESSEDEQANDIGQKFNTGVTQNTEFINRYYKYQDIIKGIPDALPSWKHEDDPNLFVPMTETLVETVTAEFFMMLFAQNPWISFQPNRAEDLLVTKLMERCIHYQITQRIPEAYTQLYLAVKEAVAMGHSMMFLYFNKNSRVAEEVSEVKDEEGNPLLDPSGNPLLHVEVNEVVDYEGLQFKVLDPNCYAIDWDRPDWRKNWVCVKEEILPEEYLDRVKSQGYTPLTEDQLEKSIVWGQDSKQYKKQKDAINRPRLILIHYYGKGFINQTWMDIKCTALDHCGFYHQPLMLVHKMPLRFKPFVQFKLIPESGTARGRGVCDQIYDMQIALNNMFNARQLAIAYALYPGLIVGEDAGVKDPDDFIAKPMQVIKCQNPEAIKPIQRNVIPPEAFMCTEEIKRTMESVTAAQDIIQGRTVRQELATTAQIINQNARQRISLQIFRMARDAVSTLGDVMRQMTVELYNPDDELTAILTQDEMDRFGLDLQGKISPEGFITVKVSDISKGMFAVTNVSAVDGDERAMRQELLQLGQIIMGTAAQGWPTGEIYQDANGQPIIDPQSGLPLQKYRTLNMDDWIKELFRTWKRSDRKLMFRDIPGPVMMPGTQNKPVQQSGVTDTSGPGIPGATAAKPVQDVQSQLQAFDQAISQEG